MSNSLVELLPNLTDKWSDFIKAIIDTFIMELWAGAIVFVIGFVFGIILTVTVSGGILENKYIYKTLDLVTNLFRSIPFTKT